MKEKASETYDNMKEKASEYKDEADKKLHNANIEI